MIRRLITAAGAGIFVTLGLMFAMGTMIDFGIGAETERRPAPELRFVRQPPPEPTEPIDEPPARIPDVIPPPPTTLVTDESGPGPIRFTYAQPTAPASPSMRFTGFVSDGPLVSLVRVEPSYPPRAMKLGLEGHVVLEFTVRPDGTTADHRVLESSHRLFEPAAVRAAERFRFKPRVIEGLPVATPGVRNVFRFEME